MIVDKKDRLLFMGDSITDSNRNYQAIPAGWSSWGDGYVNLINAYTTALLPQMELMIVNRGVSGDTVVDLKKRWKDDVWRHFDGTFAQTELVGIERFESELRDLIEQTLSNVKGMILLSPFMVEANKEDPLRKMLANYQQVLAKVAQEYGILLGDTQEKFDDFLLYQSSYVLSSDRVHPSTAGHVLIAKTWLETVGILEEKQ
ncbi:SGNH/GDSL hydrolase family protein [Enterococcus casseliflavus]|uniref:SGNH/GDSL hydrolase family protein n=1 Tax=Enterococcus casseliflavus TaxID=37734 RepID=UPI003DA69F3E